MWARFSPALTTSNFPLTPRFRVGHFFLGPRQDTLASGFRKETAMCQCQCHTNSKWTLNRSLAGAENKSGHGEVKLRRWHFDLANNRRYVRSLAQGERVVLEEVSRAWSHFLIQGLFSAPRIISGFLHPKDHFSILRVSKWLRIKIFSSAVAPGRILLLQGRNLLGPLPTIGLHHECQGVF